jgi:hypothetical protein
MRFWFSIWHRWKKVALKIARAQAVMLLTLFYFTLFGLYALALKLAGKDLLEKKWKQNQSFWKDKEKLPVDMESARRQF